MSAVKHAKSVLETLRRMGVPVDCCPYCGDPSDYPCNCAAPAGTEER